MTKRQTVDRWLLVVGYAGLFVGVYGKWLLQGGGLPAAITVGLLLGGVVMVVVATHHRQPAQAVRLVSAFVLSVAGMSTSQIWSEGSVWRLLVGSAVVALMPLLPFVDYARLLGRRRPRSDERNE